VHTGDDIVPKAIFAVRKGKVEGYSAAEEHIVVLVATRKETQEPQWDTWGSLG
jgi:hypothetical protein